MSIWDQFQPVSNTAVMPQQIERNAPAGAAPSGGSMTFQQANDPAFVRQKATEALTRRAQAYGKPAPSQAEIDEAVNYVLTPDAYSDGQTRSGWSPYWEERFGTPGMEGASAADKGGASTLIGAQQGYTGQPGQSPAGLPTGYSTGYQSSGGSPYPFASASGPGLAAPFNANFVPPTGTDDPGFQFALEQGQQGIERSAAAKGTLLTGGTLKDLAKYTTGAALQNYDQAFRRGLDTYGTNRDTFWGNNGNLTRNLGGLAQTGFNAANQYGQNQTNQANANGAATAVGANATNNTIGSLVDLGSQYVLGRKKPQAGTSTPDPYRTPPYVGDAVPGRTYA